MNAAAKIRLPKWGMAMAGARLTASRVHGYSNTEHPYHPYGPQA